MEIVIYLFVCLSIATIGSWQWIQCGRICSTPIVHVLMHLIKSNLLAAGHPGFVGRALSPAGGGVKTKAHFTPCPSTSTRVEKALAKLVTPRYSLPFQGRSIAQCVKCWSCFYRCSDCHIVFTSPLYHTIRLKCGFFTPFLDCWEGGVYLCDFNLVCL